MVLIWVRGGQAFQPKPAARKRAGLAEGSSHRGVVSFHILRERMNGALTLGIKGTLGPSNGSSRSIHT